MKLFPQHVGVGLIKYCVNVFRVLIVLDWNIGEFFLDDSVYKWTAHLGFGVAGFSDGTAEFGWFGVWGSGSSAFKDHFTFPVTFKSPGITADFSSSSSYHIELEDVVVPSVVYEEKYDYQGNIVAYTPYVVTKIKLVVPRASSYAE